MLNFRHSLPEGFLNTSAAELFHILDGPTIIHLSGHRAPPLFVSILLHGNEDVGLRAIQQVLARYAHLQLPRELILFVGNIDAARHGLRMLPGQEDFNRVWPGTLLPHSPATECMRKVVEYCRQTGVFVSLDLHNNTGANPLYSCIETIDARTLQLALLFSRTIVYFRIPFGVQTGAMSTLCPAITCECGKVGDPQGVQRAADLVDACLHMRDLPAHWPAKGDFHLLHSIATIKVAPEATLSFSHEAIQADWQFDPDFDKWNFRPLPAGSRFGRRRPGSPSVLKIQNEQNQDITDSVIEMKDDSIILRRSVIPAMLTMNVQVIHEDCLGYFMEEYDGASAPLS